MAVDDVQEIEALAELGIAAADVKKAKEGGFHTIQSLIMNPRKVGLQKQRQCQWLDGRMSERSFGPLNNLQQGLGL